MGIAERHSREKEALRNKILEAASRIFVEEGVECVSIRRIAERIEYSPATIYLYFRDKSELLETICRDTFLRLNERLEAGARSVGAGGTSPLLTLESGLRTFIEFGLAHPHHYLAAFSGASWRRQSGGSGGEAVEHPGYSSFQYLRRVVQACIEAGDIRNGDLDVICQSILMVIHGVTAMLIAAQSDRAFPWADSRRLIDQTMETLKRGLR